MSRAQCETLCVMSHLSFLDIRFKISNLLVERNIEIKYALSKKSNVGIMLFDITGRRVETLVNQTQNAGYYSVPMSTSDLPYGVYFLRMRAGGYNKTIKLVKVR